ncbi:MAG: hypothetical protein ACJ768_14475 [Gaiellaceae bacterium]
MPAITITVPPEQREDLQQELLAHYGIKAEAIYRPVDHHLSGEEPSSRCSASARSWPRSTR